MKNVIIGFIITISSLFSFNIKNSYLTVLSVSIGLLFICSDKVTLFTDKQIMEILIKIIAVLIEG